MERVSPVLPLLFEDPLTGEEDDGDEDAILRPPSAQDALPCTDGHGSTRGLSQGRG